MPRKLLGPTIGAPTLDMHHFELRITYSSLYWIAADDSNRITAFLVYTHMYYQVDSLL